VEDVKAASKQLVISSIHLPFCQPIVGNKYKQASVQHRAQSTTGLLPLHRHKFTHIL